MWGMYNRTANARDTHLLVAARIRKAVKEGTYAERLPPTSEFTEAYSVSRGVVHRALHILRDEGLIESVQGVGWYVAGTGDRRPADIRIRELITSEKFAPGDRFLSETQLSTVLGVSRITIRSALARLEGQGIVSSATPAGRTVL